MAGSACMTDEVVARAASTADEVLAEAASTADTVVPEAASTADEVPFFQCSRHVPFPLFFTKNILTLYRGLARRDSGI